MKNKYEISNNTCALVAKSEDNILIIEKEGEIELSTKMQKFINYNCEYYGSSFLGRLKGSKSLLGMKYKLPIIIEESREIIFFPTKAYNSESCDWISLNNIVDYENHNLKTLVTFNNNQKYLFDISIDSFENQVLRATKLLLILKNRKKEIK